MSSSTLTYEFAAFNFFPKLYFDTLIINFGMCTSWWLPTLVKPKYIKYTCRKPSQQVRLDSSSASNPENRECVRVDIWTLKQSRPTNRSATNMWTSKHKTLK